MQQEDLKTKIPKRNHFNWMETLPVASSNMENFKCLRKIELEVSKGVPLASLALSFNLTLSFGLALF